MGFELEIARSLGEFKRVSADWDRLAGKFASPLLEHDWFLACAETLHASADLHVLLVRRDGQLVAAAPLVLVGRGALGRLELLGASTLFEPSGFVYEDDQSLRYLCRCIVDQSLPMHLQRLPSEGAVDRELFRAAKNRGWVSRGTAGETMFLDRGAGWADFLQSRSAQRRYDVRRARRRLDAIGPVRFRALAPHPDDVDELLSRAFAIESSGWKGRCGSAVDLRPSLRRFMTNYAKRAATRGELRLGLLEAESFSMAMEIAVESHGRYWILKIGYDERWEKCSPGLLLLLEGIRAAQERGVRGHEFLGNAEPWLRPWSSGAHAYVSFRFYPRSTVGALSWAHDQLMRADARLRVLVRSWGDSAWLRQSCVRTLRWKTPNIASDD